MRKKNLWIVSLEANNSFPGKTDIFKYNKSHELGLPKLWDQNNFTGPENFVENTIILGNFTLIQSKEKKFFTTTSTGPASDNGIPIILTNPLYPHSVKVVWEKVTPLWLLTPRQGLDLVGTKKQQTHSPRYTNAIRNGHCPATPK